jgi:hypothetical protein
MFSLCKQYLNHHIFFQALKLDIWRVTNWSFSLSLVHCNVSECKEDVGHFNFSNVASRRMDAL